MSSRRPNIHVPIPHRGSPRQPANKPKTPSRVVTYRYEGDMVYVPPAETYAEALTYAQAVFPQLAHISRDRIVFFLNVYVKEQGQAVRISPMSWPEVAATLNTYEIVDLRVLPHSQLSRAAKSESDVGSSKHDGDLEDDINVETPDCPPDYQDRDATRIGDDNLLGYGLRESACVFTNDAYIHPTSPTGIKRSSSALGWIGKQFAMK